MDRMHRRSVSSSPVGLELEGAVEGAVEVENPVGGAEPSLPPDSPEPETEPESEPEPLRPQTSDPLDAGVEESSPRPG